MATANTSREKEGPSAAAPPLPSRYEAQKRRDWNTFGQYLNNLRPPAPLSACTTDHVLDFIRYLDQFGKTKVHVLGCRFFGQPEPPEPCACPLRQAWGSLDALVGRLRAAYEENGGMPENNPFAGASVRAFLRQVRESQAKARGIPYKKKKKKKDVDPVNATAVDEEKLSEDEDDDQLHIASYQISRSSLEKESRFWLTSICLWRFSELLQVIDQKVE